MKLTPTVMEGIVGGVKESILPLCRIASSSGITYQTLRNWLRNGEAYQQQLEEGKIRKRDLSIKQKREVELFSRVEEARTDNELGYLERIHKIADEKDDIKAFQWLLKIQNPFYRDADIEETDAGNKSVQVLVVNLSDTGVESSQLLSEFMHRSAKDAEEEKGRIEGPGDRDNP